MLSPTAESTTAQLETFLVSATSETPDDLNQTLARPRPTLDTANAARTSARRYRAEWLIALTEGLINPFELFEQAATEEGKPLRKLSLRQVLLSQPGWGKSKTYPRLEMLRDTLKASNAEKLTVGWLIDPRSGGRRFLTFLDIFTATKTEPPWPGFPFAPAPLSVQRNSIHDWVLKGTK